MAKSLSGKAGARKDHAIKAPMTLRERVDQFIGRRRAQIMAAAVALIAALPGLFALPPTDRDEARFAEASAQMLETGDFTNIMFQDQPRYKKPVGIYWLQSLSVEVLSSVEQREIWAYRIPSLLGAMLAAAACAWGALAFLTPGEAAMAGSLLAATTVLSTEADLATTDAVLCGVITLSMAALGKLYLAAQEGPPVGRSVRALFWIGLGASILLKGPIGPLVVGLTAVSLSAWDRKWRWLGSLGWSSGLIILAGMVLPWALAITVATDGGFWGAAVGGDLAPKLLGGQEGHGAPPGYFLILSPVLLFPSVLLLPAGVVEAWQRRTDPAIRFAICWLAPSWLVFELTPTKLPHYTLPCFGALCWLMASALRKPLGRRVRWVGAALAAAVGVGFAIAGAVGASLFGTWASWAWELLGGALMAGSGLTAAYFLLQRRAGMAAGLACGIGVIGHGALVGGLAPSLTSLWLSERVSTALAEANINPRQGLAQGPVTVAGYAEPSLVFALGAPTLLGGAEDAAAAIDEGRPAVVEGRQDAAFRAGLASRNLTARGVGQVTGLDYSTGRPQILRLYAPAPSPPPG
jgi:4-amino-4-deoxy-L-arabinose transferase-like glycosyltransferase